MGEEILYRRVMKGKKTTYEVYTPPDEPPVVYDLTEAQALTVAGSLGVTLLHLFERHIPPHKRNARKIKAVESAVLDLFKGSGQALDVDVADWLCSCWDSAVKMAEFGATKEA